MTQKNMTHKDQMRLDRENLILEVTLSILKERGFQGLTMQGVANAAEYSKGTIYQHFGCKEDLITKLVAQCGERLIGMIDVAIQNAEGLRYKVVLVSWAFFKNAQIHPELTSVLSRVKSPDFQNKVHEKFQDELAVIDQTILSRVMGLFINQPGMSAEQVKVSAFGWWAMKWGFQDVLVNQWELSKLGFEEPIRYFFDALHIFLDGLGVAQDEISRDFSLVQKKADLIFDVS